MAKARKTNLMRDSADKEVGSVPPSEASLLEHLRTAMFAIEAGIQTDDWNAVAEGQAMLEEILSQVEKGANQ